RWRFSSDTLAFNGLGELADAILHAVDEWIDRLGLPIGIQGVRLVVVFFEYGTEFGQRSEILRLQGERVAQRGQRIFVIVLLRRQRRAPVPGFGEIGGDD